METINLFGASGHAKVIKDIIEASGNRIGYLYDDYPRSSKIHGSPVVKPSEIPVKGPMIISIGSNSVRKAIANRYHINYTKAIHPASIISQSVMIGMGTVVMQGSIIQSDVRIGNHCIINTGASIDHECKIGDFVHISPHATLCGNVSVGEGSWIGAGAIIIPGIRIGKWSVIGAGAVVISDIPDNVVAVGNPCIITRHLNTQHIINQRFTGGGNLYFLANVLAA